MASADVYPNGLILCVLTYKIDIHCVGWVTGNIRSSKHIHTEEECGNSSRVSLTQCRAMRLLPIQKN